jgi:hypothetical protein
MARSGTRDFTHIGMSAHRGRLPCVTKEAGGPAGLVSGAAAAWLSSGVRLMAGGGDLYDSRVRRCRSRPCRVVGLPGPFRPQELCTGTLPGHDAGRCGAGRRRMACGAGNPDGRAVSVTAPIPVVRGQAFSCPWLAGSRGAPTCSGRRWPKTCLVARIRWSARLTRVGDRSSLSRRVSPCRAADRHIPPGA